MGNQPFVWMNGLNSQALDFTLIPVRVGFGSGADRLQIYEHFARRNPLAEALLSQGRVVLRDLDFETGSTQLSGGDYPSLQALAEGSPPSPVARPGRCPHHHTPQ